ncbi:MAG: alkaline phosphatase family protein [Verrucomicrobia bacterium]|nr:MAG: alkaline phosphatase family protein [Verrucomicrobiota bacterium]
MSRDKHREAPRWRRSRYGFVFFCIATLLVAWTGLRLLLLFKFAHPFRSDAQAVLLEGLRRDGFTALVMLLPLLVWFLIIPDRWLVRTWHRYFFRFACWVWGTAQVFLLIVEYYFFEEFMSRFNTVAVDYVLYPHEVFVNLWDSYPMVPLVLASAFFGLVWVWLGHRWFASMWELPVRPFRRLLWLLLVAVLAGVVATTVNFKGTKATGDRTLDEIANNGEIAFACAAWTHNLDYSAFYQTMDLKDAYQRVRSLTGTNSSEFVAEGNSLQRKVAGDLSRPKLNVVLILEESLGSEFWGCLGRTNSLTPEMDKLATHEGLLFENLYACGNRTVRGMEGVLASFPPLPGDSIVKRDRSDNIETIARLLKRDGYETLFLYGGRGIFDGLRSFTTRNGYDRFIEQSDLANPTFTTIWGVCDEDLFDRTIQECRELNRAGKPFLATALTVSNHKPYTYPRGRIREDPEQKTRANAVKYTDYSLGRFFEMAKKEAFWTNTIFAVVADHGARVYGSQAIPIHSYEIPLVVLGPAAVKQPVRINALGGSLDVSPTLLGLIGRPYETTFFGRDLLSSPAESAHAVMHHNRDIGTYMRERLTVLGLRQSVDFYAGDPKKVNLQKMAKATDLENELAKDTIAIFQVADDLYTRQRYNLGTNSVSTPAK